MSQDTSHGRTEQVAVGATRELAARPFGVGQDDLLLTSFDDFATEVDLEAVAAVLLAPGPGADPTLQAVAEAQRQRPDLALWTTAPEEDGTGFLAQLERLGLQIGGVRGRPGAVQLRLEQREAARGSTDELVLAALLLAAAPPTADAAVEPAPGPPDTAAGAHAGVGPKERPVPRLVRAYDAARHLVDGPRRRAAFLVAGLVAVAVLVALGAWLRAGTGALLLVVPLVAVAVLGAAGVIVVAVLLLARQVNAQTARQERMLLRNRAVMLKQTTEMERRLRNIEAGTARYPFALSYLEALAELAAETSARVKSIEDALVDGGIWPGRAHPTDSAPPVSPEP